MTLSELVPSLALCQQLKAAGFPQDTALVWVSAREMDDSDSIEDKWILTERACVLMDDGGPMYRFVAAPTMAEMLECQKQHGMNISLKVAG